MQKGGGFLIDKIEVVCVLPDNTYITYIHKYNNKLEEQAIKIKKFIKIIQYDQFFFNGN